MGVNVLINAIERMRKKATKASSVCGGTKPVKSNTLAHATSAIIPIRESAERFVTISYLNKLKPLLLLRGASLRRRLS